MKGLCDFVRRIYRHVDWVWIDSCCIDKTKESELSEAINCMFKWYTDAVECCAYLEDVHNLNAWSSSVWFERGWTLQDLLAPRVVVFVASNWVVIGHKRSSGDCKFHHHNVPRDANPILNRAISSITQIPSEVLWNFD